MYALACAFLLLAVFAKPREDSPFGSSTTKIQWFVIPVIGLSVPFWDVLWYLGLRLAMVIRGKVLQVSRLPCIKEDEGMEGEWIVKWEIVTHEWPSRYALQEELGV